MPLIEEVTDQGADLLGLPPTNNQRNETQLWCVRTSVLFCFFFYRILNDCNSRLAVGVKRRGDTRHDCPFKLVTGPGQDARTPRPQASRTRTATGSRRSPRIQRRCPMARGTSAAPTGRRCSPTTAATQTRNYFLYETNWTLRKLEWTS